MNPKICVGVWDYGMGSCRYVGEGYKPYMNFEQRVREIAKLKDVSGIEITYPNDINENTWPEAKKLLEELGLTVAGMGVEVVCDKQWKTGSLTSHDAEIRKMAVELIKNAMKFAKSIGVKTVSLWLGQDGFDYLFQNDYVKAYDYLIAGLKECAQSEPSVNLGIEYKVSEPRMSCMMKNAGMALAAAYETGCSNVGITLDVGHAFNAGENPAEIAALLHSRNKLFHVHVNDNYRIADDDMPVGSVHWPQYFEFFYWMKKLGYEGWYSLDLYPYRDDPGAACEASVTFVKGAIKFAEEKLPADFVTGTEEVPGKILNNLYKAFFGGC